MPRRKPTASKPPESPDSPNPVAQAPSVAKAPAKAKADAPARLRALVNIPHTMVPGATQRIERGTVFDAPPTAERLLGLRYAEAA